MDRGRRCSMQRRNRWLSGVTDSLLRGQEFVEEEFYVEQSQSWTDSRAVCTRWPGDVTPGHTSDKICSAPSCGDCCHSRLKSTLPPPAAASAQHCHSNSSILSEVFSARRRRDVVAISSLSKDCHVPLIEDDRTKFFQKTYHYAVFEWRFAQATQLVMIISLAHRQW